VKHRIPSVRPGGSGRAPLRPEGVALAWARDRDGRMVAVRALDEASRRARAPFTCPGCGDELVARLGAVRARHFAHRPGSTCPLTAPETALHFNAKARLLALCADAFAGARAVTVLTRCPACRRGDPRPLADLGDAAAAEGAVGALRADVLLTRRGEPALALEVLVTHAVDAAKQAALTAAAVPMIEIDAREAWEREGAAPGSAARGHGAETGPGGNARGRRGAREQRGLPGGHGEDGDQRGLPAGRRGGGHPGEAPSPRRAATGRGRGVRGGGEHDEPSRWPPSRTGAGPDLAPVEIDVHRSAGFPPCPACQAAARADQDRAQGGELAQIAELEAYRARGLLEADARGARRTGAGRLSDGEISNLSARFHCPDCGEGTLEVGVRLALHRCPRQGERPVAWRGYDGRLAELRWWKR